MKTEFEFLVRLIQSNSLDIRLTAIGAIAKTKQNNSLVIEILSHVIKFNSEPEKSAAIQALGEIGGRDAIDILMNEIQTPTTNSIKKLAINALGEAMKNTELNELAENLADHKQESRLRVM